MKKECWHCKRVYDFCPSCILTRPYLQKFCCIKCKEDYIEKINNGVKEGDN